jgi:AraC family transcriptional regulator
MEMLPIATSTSEAGFANAAVSAAVMKLLTDANEAIDADRDAAKSCIARATALLRAEYDGQEQAAPDASAPGGSGLAPWQVIKVKAYMEANLDRPIQVAELARICRLSGSYFPVAFKRRFGETVHACMNRRRVERAQDRMLNSGEALSRIALDCGFCDQAHLSRMFRRLIGVSPHRWRRQFPHRAA